MPVARAIYQMDSSGPGLPSDPEPLAGVSWSPESGASVNTPLTLAAVTGAAETDTVSYTVVSGSCSFGSGTDEALRTLSFTGAGNCVVKATVERIGYTTWDSGNQTIVVTAISVPGVDWNPALAGTVGVALVLPTVTGTVGGDTVTYSRVSGPCSVVSATRTVSFTGTANCVVRARVQRGTQGRNIDKTIRVAPSGTPALVLTNNPTIDNQ